MLHNKTSSSEFDLKEVGAQPALAPSVALVLFLHRPLVGVVFIAVVDLEALLDDARKERERRFNSRNSKSDREQLFFLIEFVRLCFSPSSPRIESGHSRNVMEWILRAVLRGHFLKSALYHYFCPLRKKEYSLCLP